MTPLEALKAVCPTGTAEGEKQFLEDAFVTPGDYAEIIAPPPGSPRLLVGKKGSGKSILLSILASRCASAGIPAILIKPDDLPIAYPPSPADMGTLKRVAWESLMRAIAIKLGEGLSGLISENDAKLFDAAVEKGTQRPDMLQRLLKPLAKLGKTVTNIDFEAFVPRSNSQTPSSLANAIKTNLSRTSNEVLFLLVDDTDQVASPEQADQLNRIWAIMLAASGPHRI